MQNVVALYSAKIIKITLTITIKIIINNKKFRVVLSIF